MATDIRQGSGQAATNQRDSYRAREDGSDTRVYADPNAHANQADVSAKGEHFILASWASLAAGLWLLLAPWVLTFAGYAPKARANDLILGALIASMGATRVFGNYRSGRLNQMISGLTVLPGIWLIAAPFVLRYSGHPRPTYSDVITGVATIVFAAWAFASSRNDYDQDQGHKKSGGHKRTAATSLTRVKRR